MNTTRQEVRRAEKSREQRKDIYNALFSMLFHNSVEFDYLPSDLPKRYLLRVLKNKGGIAYDRETQLYLPFVEKGIDVYGLPQSYNLIGYNGLVLERKPEQVVILRANDLKFSIERYLEEQIEKIVNFDMAIDQNLEAIKTMSIGEVSSGANLLSLINEQNAKRIGATLIFRNKGAMAGTELKLSNTGAQYLLDKLFRERRALISETLSCIGIKLANEEKKERVQNEEIRSAQSYALDCIQTLIDTFNYDAKVGGLSIRMKGNTNLYKQNELIVKQLMNETETQKGE